MNGQDCYIDAVHFDGVYLVFLETVSCFFTSTGFGSLAGFTTGTPINKVNENYLEGVNILDEMKDPYSILNYYQYAISKRKDPITNDQVLNGKLELLDENHPDVFAYMHDGIDKLAVISNFRDYDVKFSMYFRIKDVVLHNYDGVLLDQNKVLTLRPFECLVLKIR